jgi:hypothetical protein
LAASGGIINYTSKFNLDNYYIILCRRMSNKHSMSTIVCCDD